MQCVQALWMMDVLLLTSILQHMVPLPVLPPMANVFREWLENLFTNIDWYVVLHS